MCSAAQAAIVPPDTQQKLRATLPTGEVVVMPGLGHYPNEEDTKGFLLIVNRFLQARVITRSFAMVARTGQLLLRPRPVGGARARAMPTRHERLIRA